MNRSDVIGKLDCRVENMFNEVEKASGLKVQFQMLSGSSVVAKYKYDPYTSTATILLRSDWQYVDVAHELTHMKLELIEGFTVLAWRSGVAKTKAVESAFGRIRSYVDDEVVHSRLAEQGFMLNGEVIKSQLFDDIYTNVPKYLRKLCSRKDDGMAHLDQFGYGELCRTCFLVQAELVRNNYNDVLLESNRKKLRRFIDDFRIYRSVEASKADQVLELFRANDVSTVAGHKRILESWAQTESLDRFVGPSTYTKGQSGYILPWPN